MTDIPLGSEPAVQATPVLSARAASILPPLAAMTFPLYVWCFFTSLSAMRAAEGNGKVPFLFATAASLCLTAIPTLASYFLLLRPREHSDAFLGKRWIAYLAFASPALFTLELVVFAGLRISPNDWLFWLPVWAALTIFAAIPSEQRFIARTGAQTRKLRFAHGVSAATILVLFLVAHLGNHFVGLLGAQVHIDVMDFLRKWYRIGLVEAGILGLFLFQVVTGLKLALVKQSERNEPFRILQIGTGIGLMTFLSAHLLIILVFARWVNNVDTNWIFATGSKTGLLGSLNYSRLVPYYWFAVFTIFTHLACGLRVVFLSHGMGKLLSDRLALAVICIGALFASATVAGMVGFRL
ncbi:hypothetical protein [Bradyrhizobium sp. NP1]|uniref:hypothetical protein n=1 Tax=Bradyrhizobium sp. NP1 TaxID=3049772 RepID=UPI0025A4F0E7|nr:hypothetical protein [Bradyrhizobium sp. NP1]WJR76866.1 hypothetical protein QOU61_29555 [Bradyrhizobium sp. NP1]